MPVSTYPGDLAIPDISVVIPCRNEALNAEPIAAAVITQCELANVSFDLIFIDNGSTDGTVAIIRSLCASDPRIRLIINTRDFGQMRSPTHGIYAARGRSVIGMCADFQDPPELIGQFISQWRDGSEIVLGVRESEKSALLLTVMRNISYYLASRLGDYTPIDNATGFGLYDRKVVDTLAALNEPEPFFRAMLVETGYTISTIPYVRPQRRMGKTNNNFFTLLDFALSALANSAKQLLRLPFLFALVMGLAAMTTLIVAVIQFALGNASLIWLLSSIIEVQFALLFAFVGLIGDQVRLVSDRTRRSPLVIERERVNFPLDY